ncbi:MULTISPECIES: hypothetical protein [Empedobacter]|uniref:SoxR reducing system RseC family protein n=1 Tax=Empedobacter falsenii TaxID=343874 RepID=A0A3R8URG1_9FLAO|nr:MULTISPECIES: hypothetical protein [Empedobacter]HBX63131.1 hypothetical protein [Flavobacteriaceae bacterium]MBW1618905.1 hypothetical protein [Empedobacter falsenii]MBY0067547.1 hypothetical protein [Empedobacter falsenii]MDH1602417.1 hypothetical protein [Empedobacter sp. GD03739]MDM1138996.1 hypothetical protein [Empedobacter sp. R132-2]
MKKNLEFIAELYGWIQIFISPFIIGFIIGLLIYFQNKSISNLIIGSIFILTGLILGIILANKKMKSKNGTIWFLSRTNSATDLDK